jgi:hypothetical protein
MKIGQGDHVAVAGVGADQVGIVDPGIVDVLARRPLGLQLFNDVAFLDQVERNLDAGDFFKRLGQGLGLVLMGRNGFGDDLDVHAFKRLGRLDEPFHFLELFFFGQGRGLELLVNPLLGGRHIRHGRTCRQCEHDRQCDSQKHRLFHFHYHGSPPFSLQGWGWFWRTHRGREGRYRPTIGSRPFFWVERLWIGGLQ